MPFLITGTGRCGTGFVAAVLSSIGIPTGHESVYGLDGPPDEWPEGVAGDASWLAFPFYQDHDGPVVHLRRDPTEVAESLERIQFFRVEAYELHEPYMDFVEEYFPIGLPHSPSGFPRFIDDHLRSDSTIALTLELSDLNTHTGWEPLWPVIGVPKPPDHILQRAIETYRYANIRGHIPEGNFTVGFIHNRDFVLEFVNFMFRCGRRNRNVIGVHAGSRVPTGRNNLIRRFLDETDHEWLFMVDTDHHVPERAIEILFSVANKDTHPIVGGITFRRNDNHRLEPTIYRFNKESMSFGIATAYPPNTVMEVDATGAACVVVHRSVFEAIRDNQESNSPYIWFQDTELLGHEIGEDVTFFMRAAHLGFPVHVHTAAEFPHIKVDGLTAKRWREERLLEQWDRQESERMGYKLTRDAAFEQASEPQTEESLIEHYDSNLTYYSPLDHIDLSVMLELVDWKLPVGANVLDLGCGDGRLVEHLPLGVTYEGVDYSEQRIKAARAKWGKIPGVKFTYASIHDMSVRPGWDLVVAVELLEHLEDPQATIDRYRSRLTSNGIILATVPINLPYHAHLHVWETADEMVAALNPDAWTTLPGGKHWVLRFDPVSP